MCLKANSEYQICSKKTFQKKATTSWEEIVEKVKAISEELLLGVIMVIEDFNFFLPHARVLDGWTEINYGNPTE